MSLLAHPITQSVVLPLAVCAAGLGLVRVSPSVPVAGAIITAAELACVLAMLGLPDWPPRGGMQKLPVLLFAAAMVAVALQGFGASAQVRTAAACGFATGAVAWLAWPSLHDGGPLAVAALVAAVPAVTMAVARAGRPRRVRESALMLVAASASLCAVAVASSSLALAQAVGALVAAATLLAAWVLLAGAAAQAAAALSWGVVVLAMLAALTALLTSASGWALAVLTLVFVADRPFAGRDDGAGRTLMVGALAIALAAAVVAVALVSSMASGPAGDPYY